MAIIVNGKKVAGLGLPGKDGAPGADGKDGAPGKSAYQAAKEKGYTGTEEEFNTALAGMQSAPFLPLAGGTMKSGATIQGTDSLSIISPQQIQIATGSTAIRITGNTIVLGGDGANTSFFGTLNMDGYPIKSVPSPVDLTDAANKQYVDEHTGAKVVTGSYVGTGKTGKNNPTEISLPKPFKVLCIYGMQYPDSYYDIYPTDSTSTGQTCNIISGSSIPTEYTRYFGFFYSSKPSDSYGKKSADGKTFSWYYDLTPSSAASVQLNKSGTIYHYYAIL